MAYTKKQALSIVFQCATEYHNNLVGKNLLLVAMNKHHAYSFTEITFDAGNFKHMTGFQTQLEPRHFFQLCLDRRLREADFEFAKDGTTSLKMQILPHLVKKNLSARMIGDYNLSHPKLYTDKVAGSVSACIGFIKTGPNGRYVPNTVFEEDVRKNVKQADRILLIYRKDRSDTSYQEIVYAAKKIDWERIVLPEKYSDLPLPKDNE